MIVYNKQILYSISNRYIAYKKGCIYSVSSDLKECRLLCHIPMTIKEKIICRIPIIARMLRFTPRAVVAVDSDSIIFAYRGCIYNLNSNSGVLTCEHKFPAPMRAPLSFSKLDNVAGFENTIIYGEYHGNSAHGQMSVYSRDTSGNWSPCYSFPANSILHIHGFAVDTINSRVLILTGDKDRESGIWEAYNNFDSVRPLIIGSQSYRSCVAFQTKEGEVLYATDTPLQKNSLFVYKKDGVQKLYDMPSPCIFGIEYNENYYFSTSVEGDSRIKGYKYLFTKKLGEGVKDRYVHIISGNPRDGFKDIMKLKKDWLPYTLFEFGNATFCKGLNGQIIINPQSIKGFFHKSIILNSVNHEK